MQAGVNLIIEDLELNDEDIWDLDIPEEKREIVMQIFTVYVKTAEPARKPWQGLDEDEVEEILEGFPMGTYSEQAFAQAIEQALKEKNT